MLCFRDVEMDTLRASNGFYSGWIDFKQGEGEALGPNVRVEFCRVAEVSQELAQSWLDLAGSQAGSRAG